MVRIFIIVGPFQARTLQDRSSGLFNSLSDSSWKAGPGRVAEDNVKTPVVFGPEDVANAARYWARRRINALSTDVEKYPLPQVFKLQFREWLGAGSEFQSSQVQTQSCEPESVLAYVEASQLAIQDLTDRPPIRPLVPRLSTSRDKFSEKPTQGDAGPTCGSRTSPSSAESSS